MELSIIFYGAGKYARENIGRWLSAGLNPICFADADKGKWHTDFSINDDRLKLTRGGVSIISLSEAVERYPDYVLYLTVAPYNLKKIGNDLLKSGIPQARIRSADGLGYRLGCSSLGTVVMFSADRMHCCCMDVPKWHLKRSGDMCKDYSAYKQLVHGIIEKLQLGERTSCTDCPRAFTDWWPMESKIQSIVLGSDTKGVRCNAKCIHCIASEQLKRSNEYENIDIIDELRSGYEAIGDNSITLSLGPGELTVHPQCAQVLDFIDEKQWKTWIFTNAFLFNERICEMLNSGPVIGIIISLDCGTRETFAKIKGVDCFGEVVSNLEKYNYGNGKVVCQYVFLKGINDNSADVAGFCDIVLKAGINNVSVRVDLRYNGELSQRQVQLIQDMIFRLGGRVSIDTSMSEFKEYESLRECALAALR